MGKFSCFVCQYMLSISRVCTQIMKVVVCACPIWNQSYNSVHATNKLRTTSYQIWSMVWSRQTFFIYGKYGVLCIASGSNGFVMFYNCNILFALFTFGVSALSLEEVVSPHHNSERIVADGKLPQLHRSWILVMYYKYFQISDYILCRSCGADIASSHHITYIKSPAALAAFNDTLFNRDKVLVQVLSSGIFLQFPVITSVQSTCITVGEVKNSLITWIFNQHSYIIGNKIDK